MAMQRETAGTVGVIAFSQVSLVRSGIQTQILLTDEADPLVRLGAGVRTWSTSECALAPGHDRHSDIGRMGSGESSIAAIRAQLDVALIY